MSANPKTITTLGSDLFIAGQWKPGDAGSLENIDPGNGETIGAVTLANQADVQAALGRIRVNPFHLPPRLTGWEVPNGADLDSYGAAARLPRNKFPANTNFGCRLHGLELIGSIRDE